MDHNRQTWSQSTEFSSIMLKLDADGHSLHNLGEVTGGVFRRDNAELRTRSRRKARDVPTKTDAR